MDAEARITEAGSEFNGGESNLAGRRQGRSGASIPGGGDMGAIAPAHQDAILLVTQIRQLDRQPYAYADQKSGKEDRCHIGRHPVPVIVWLNPVAPISRRVISAGVYVAVSAGISHGSRRLRQRLRPEFQHATVRLRDTGSLNRHMENPQVANRYI